MKLISRLHSPLLSPLHNILYQPKIREIKLFSAPFCSETNYTHDNPPCYSLLSFYKLRRISRPDEMKSNLTNFLSDQRATGRLYLNRQGVNVSLCVEKERKEIVMETLRNMLDMETEDVVNVHSAGFKVFQKLRVKHGKLLEGLEEDRDLGERGEVVDSKTWNHVIDSEDGVVVDVRNSYEWEVGRFKGSDRPPVHMFRDFGNVADRLEQKYDKNSKPILMYCTGGIRCEVFSSVLKQRGWDKVIQLKGGVLGYGSQNGEDTEGSRVFKGNGTELNATLEGSDKERGTKPGEDLTRHWEGNLFVFDDRLVVPIDGKVGGDLDNVVGRCRHCGDTAEMCYNCNSMHCNQIFIACYSCARTYSGCCSSSCLSNTSHHFVPRNPRQWSWAQDMSEKEVQSRMVGRGKHFRNWVADMRSEI